MATLTIKNVPDALYHRLKEQAALNHRSLNNEAIVSLTLVVNQSNPSAKQIISKARAVRIKKNDVIQLTDVLIEQAKGEGRS